MLLLEYLQNNVYRAQGIMSFFSVLKTNKFRTSIATHGDQKFNSGKLYYFSTARTLNSEFIQDACEDDLILILDGYKLNNSFRSTPVKYFSSWNENEERIITDKPYIENALKYIKEVHVCLSYSSYSKYFFDNIMDMDKKLKSENINVWYYYDLKDFLKLNIKNASKYPKIKAETDPQYISNYFEDSSNEIIDILEEPIDIIEICPSLEKIIKKFILKENINLNEIDKLVLSRIKNKEYDDYFYVLITEKIIHSDRCRTGLHSLARTLRVAQIPFNIEKILESIRANLEIQS